MTPESLIRQAARTGYHTAALVERLMRDRPHPERWSRKFGPVVKVDRMTRETIRNGKEKDAYA
jgi:hypothetical protein